MKYRKIKFPKDELAHNYIIEWWYFNGHLEDKQGNEYSFMNCFFRADIKKVKIPFLTKLPFKILHFSHSAISDIKSERFYPSIDLISIISKDSFSKPLLFINYINPAFEKGYVNCVIEETKKFVYHLKNKNIDLKLTSVKKPLLEGGKGYLVLGSKSSYCYSLTNLKTEGRIKIKNHWIDVVGKSWMDHQWANESYSKDKWNWFSIQLDNDIEIMFWEYGDEKNKGYFVDVMYSDGKQESLKKVELIPLGMEWTSSKTKATYPLAWRIKVPSKNIDLKVAPSIKEQEMIFGSINYWEGPLKVSGLFDNKKVKGVGFMELVGYPSQYSNIKYVKEELEKAVNQFFSYAKKTTFNIANNIKTRVTRQ